MFLGTYKPEVILTMEEILATTGQRVSDYMFQSKHELIYVDRSPSEAPDRYLRIKDCTLALVAEDDAASLPGTHDWNFELERITTRAG